MEKRISERQKGVGGSWKGYCQICGKFGALTKDHVPPKGAIHITKDVERQVEQRLMTEVDGFAGHNDVKNIKGVVGKSGSTFMTLCKSCNDSKAGGKNDDEVSRVYKELNTKLLNHFSSPYSVFNSINVELDAKKFLRAMMGHVLSATTAQACREPLKEGSPDQWLRDYVMGDDSALADNFDIYYWYYPFRRHVSARNIGFYNNGHVTTLSSLSFFPMALLVTRKNQGIFPAQAKPLTLNSTEIVLDITARNLEYSKFPFCILENNQMMAINAHVCITSMPITK